jgi:hypothetical protein
VTVVGGCSLRGSVLSVPSCVLGLSPLSRPRERRSSGLPPGGSVRGSLRRGRGSGRATAPVGCASVFTVGVVVFGCAGWFGLGSRPRKTLLRRRSSSSATPGLRSAAPVGRSGTCTVGTLPQSRRRGRSSRCGSRSITLRAIVSSTPRPRRSGFPKSRRGTRVTPRQLS